MHDYFCREFIVLIIYNYVIYYLYHVSLIFQLSDLLCHRYRIGIILFSILYMLPARRDASTTPEPSHDHRGPLSFQVPHPRRAG